MHDGNPVTVNNVLTDQIKQQLTQDLLDTANVQIVIDDQQRCIMRSTRTILGIEVTSHHNRQHRITLAMVDQEEGIWLNGTHLSWSGHLTSDQRRDLTRKPARVESRQSYTPKQTREIADALYHQLRCQGGIATPVFFAPSENMLTRSVSRLLRERLSSRSQVTVDKNVASSIIHVNYRDTFLGQGEINLELASSATPLITQRIAEVAVVQDPAGLAKTKVNPTRNHLPRSSSTADMSSPGRFLSEIYYQRDQSREGICSTNSEGCALLSFEVLEPAYLVMFSTTEGMPKPLKCDKPAKRYTGKKQFRVVVPIGARDARPTLGIYALAFKNRLAAQAVHQELVRGSSKCTSNPQLVTDWAKTFTQALHNGGAGSEWSALHLMRDANGIQSL
jgi:hypothetical protein